MRTSILFVAILMLPLPDSLGDDWITLPAAPPKSKPADPVEARRDAKLKRERSDMANDWQQAAELAPPRRARNFATYNHLNDVGAYAFHFNDSWSTPLKLPTMITAQDFPNIAPPLPPRLPHGLAAPLGGAPHNNLPSPQFNHSHW